MAGKRGHAAADITGQAFGELTVVSKAAADTEGRARWNCECSCGKSVVTQGRRLRRGEAQSCGHLRGGASSRDHEVNKKVINHQDREIGR
jgi:hypothetical protein